MASQSMPFTPDQVYNLWTSERSCIIAATAAITNESHTRMTIMQEEFKAKIAIMQEESKTRIAILEEEHKAKTAEREQAAKIKETRLNAESAQKQHWEKILVGAKMNNITYEQDARVAREGAESEERIEKIRGLGILD